MPILYTTVFENQGKSFNCLTDLDIYAEKKIRGALDSVALSVYFLMKKGQIRHIEQQKCTIFRAFA